MEQALSEISLALFTTLGPMAAGSFLALLVVFFRAAFDAEQIKRIDQLTIIPVLLGLTAFVCAFAHLSDPANALNVAITIGSTPLANEVATYSFFLLLSMIYWVAAVAGGLQSRELRLGFCLLVTAAGLLAVVFMGLAYMIPAIPVWDNPSTVVQMVAAWLFGGAALTMMICSLSGKLRKIVLSDELVCKVLMGIGALLFIGATTVIFVRGSIASSAIVNVSANSQSLMGAYVASVACAIAAALCGLFGRNLQRVPLFSCGAAFTVVSIFLGRLVFYGMEISIGL